MREREGKKGKGRGEERRREEKKRKRERTIPPAQAGVTHLNIQHNVLFILGAK